MSYFQPALSASPRQWTYSLTFLLAQNLPSTSSRLLYISSTPPLFLPIFPTLFFSVYQFLMAIERNFDFSANMKPKFSALILKVESSLLKEKNHSSPKQLIVWHPPRDFSSRGRVDLLYMLELTVLKQ